MNLRIVPTSCETRTGKAADQTSRHYIVLRGQSPDCRAAVTVAFLVASEEAAAQFLQKHGLIGVANLHEIGLEISGVILDERSSTSEITLMGRTARQLNPLELVSFRKDMRYREFHDLIEAQARSDDPAAAMRLVLEASRQYAASIGYVDVAPGLFTTPADENAEPTKPAEMVKSVEPAPSVAPIEPENQPTVASQPGKTVQPAPVRTPIAPESTAPTGPMIPHLQMRRYVPRPAAVTELPSP